MRAVRAPPMQSGSLRSTLERGRAIRKEIRRAGALAAGRPAKRAGARSCPLATACVRLRPLAPAMPRAFSRRRPFVACHRGPRRATHASAMPMRGAPRRMPTRRRRPDASITRHSPSAERRAPSAKRQAPSAKRQAPSAKRQAPIGHRSSSSVPSCGRAPLPRRRARAGCRRRNDPAGHCAMGAPQRASRRSPACGYYQIW